MRILAALLIMTASPAIAQTPTMLASLDAIGPVVAGPTEAQLKALNVPVTQKWVYDNDVEVIQYTVQVDALTNLYVLRNKNEDRAYVVQTNDPRVMTEKGANVGMTLAQLKQVYPDGQLEFHFSETNTITFTVRVMWKSTGEGKALLFSFDTYGVSDACFETKQCTDAELSGLETRLPLALELHSY